MIFTEREIDVQGVIVFLICVTLLNICYLVRHYGCNGVETVLSCC